MGEEGMKRAWRDTGASAQHTTECDAATTTAVVGKGKAKKTRPKQDGVRRLDKEGIFDADAVSPQV